MDLKKATLTDVQKLGNYDFEHFKSLIVRETERRTQPEYKEVEVVSIEDGCEPSFMDVHDFEECARNTKDGFDLIDYITQTMQQSGEVRFCVDKYPIESLREESFFGKKNPYQKK